MKISGMFLALDMFLTIQSSHKVAYVMPAQEDYDLIR